VANRCPKCDFENPDTQKFCGDCGTQLGIPSVTKTFQTPPAIPGKTISGKYKIISELGRGGMGVVYKAKDTRLKRTVALKFLPAELTKDKEAKKRFIQEAQAAAALEHSNICTVYEVDEADGQTFIAMSYIEGQSLKDKLNDGSLDIDDAKDIAIQVAEGLTEAHEKGIVHRDIKPANIMLTKKGQAKITDFGLAKLSWGVDLTKTSTIMGTVAYMSPEQARGEKVDHRTDIWALGAMLYEMLSGERPFKKDREHALIYSILNDEPKALAEIREDVPSNIENTVHKALGKDASNRYQSIQEFIQDLEQSTPIAFPKAEKSIVVLPFENLSPDPEQEYFCDGMTEEIISDLSRIHDLLVISRSSAMTYKGTKKKIKEIGEELNVQYVLEGSVRKVGNNLRITAQLIDATNDVHLWAEKYSGLLDDVFAIQEKVSRAMVDELKLKLSPEEEKKISEAPTHNIKVYECYLKAMHEINRFTNEGLDKGIKTIQNGLEILGESALLYATLGEALHLYFDLGFTTDTSILDRAEEYAEEALAIKPDSAQGYKLLGLVERGRARLKDACIHMSKAYSIDSNDAGILMYMAAFYAFYLGKSKKAEPLFERLISIDPLEPINYLFLGISYIFYGQYDLAIEPIRKHERMNPDFPHGPFWSALALAANNQLDEAYETIDRAIDEGKLTNIFMELSLIMKFALQGDREKVLEPLSPDTVTFASLPDLAVFMAGLYALVNEKEKALDCVEDVIGKGFINYPFLNEYHPFLDNIRDEPRFKKLMERVKHEWENFEV
jgi:non-specific serine/threonine protein kinase